VVLPLREVPDSSLGQQTGYPDSGSYMFPQLTLESGSDRAVALIMIMMIMMMISFTIH
jgi:hypothetical protein